VRHRSRGSLGSGRADSSEFVVRRMPHEFSARCARGRLSLLIHYEDVTRPDALRRGKLKLPNKHGYTHKSDGEGNAFI